MNKKQLTGKAEGLPDNTGESQCVSIDSPQHEAKASVATNPSADRAHVSQAAKVREQLKTENESHKSCSPSDAQNIPEPTKANCYKCKHRSALNYSAHSQCVNPVVKDHSLMLATKWKHLVATIGGVEHPLISGNQHGIDNGWFFWPIDFDPAWLESCLLFEEIDK